MAQLHPINTHPYFSVQSRRRLFSAGRRNSIDEIGSSSSSSSLQQFRLRVKKCYGTNGSSSAVSLSSTTADHDPVMGVPGNDNNSIVASISNGELTEMECDYEGEEVVADKLEDLDYLVMEHNWKVRRMIEEDGEMRKVAHIQAEAFYIPTFFFNDAFFTSFKAEVLSGLLYRLRSSPPDRYACLVAVSADTEDNVSTKSDQELVGVVDLTVLRDPDVVKHLEGAPEYLYVSGIAVSSHHRRKKVGTVLLKSCEVMSVLWGYKYLVLRAYEDDLGARSLYCNAGYQVVSGDPAWFTSLIGRKRRLLMIKRTIASLVSASVE